MKEAFEAFNERIKAWKYDPKWYDPSSRAMFTKDRKDMRAVLSACRKGDWERAADLAGSMDTILRDEIPDYLWNLMHES